MKFCLTDEIPMSAREFWDTAHAAEFAAFMAGEYGLIQREQEREISGYLMRRRLRTVVTRGFPDWVGKIATGLLGKEEIEYHEVQEIRLDAFEMHWRIDPAALTDRIQGSGRIWLTPIDGKHCLRTIEGEILVKLFGVGGKLEEIIAREIKESNENLPDIVARWKIRQAASDSGKEPSLPSLAAEEQKICSVFGAP
jgi:hypothetical protein